MAIERLSHLGLCVADMERSLGFYRDQLGFREISELRLRGPAVDTLLELEGVHLHARYLERDGLRLELLHYEAPGHCDGPVPRPMNQPGLTHLSLRVRDLASVLAGLVAAGVQVLPRTRVDNPELGAGAIFVLDPDGTRIELVQAPGNSDSLPGQPPS